MDSVFNKIGLVGKIGDDSCRHTVNVLYDYLTKKVQEVIADTSLSHLLKQKTVHFEDRLALGKHCDLVICVGGDGTLLNTARSLANFDTPMLGINLGRLGFLADIPTDSMIECLDEVLGGRYISEQRFLMNCVIKRQGKTSCEGLAFNDVVIHKWNTARMIEIDTCVNDQFVNSLRADGLIISTPTGSTAYALSSGGPILQPDLDAILMVPVSPHSLSNRPLVISADSRIKITSSENNHEYVQVTCDGQLLTNLATEDEVIIYKTKNPITLIHPDNHDYFTILRAKLRWSESPEQQAKPS